MGFCGIDGLDIETKLWWQKNCISNKTPLDNSTLTINCHSWRNCVNHTFITRLQQQRIHRCTHEYNLNFQWYLRLFFILCTDNFIQCFTFSQATWYFQQRFNLIIFIYHFRLHIVFCVLSCFECLPSYIDHNYWFNKNSMWA